MVTNKNITTLFLLIYIPAITSAFSPSNFSSEIQEALLTHKISEAQSTLETYIQSTNSQQLQIIQLIESEPSQITLISAIENNEKLF
jgi:hypothetical protein